MPHINHRSMVMWAIP